MTSGSGSRYFRMQSEPTLSPTISFRPEPGRIFDELPTASIVHISRPDAADISPMLLSYTIEFQYKQALILLVLIFFFCACVVGF